MVDLLQQHVLQLTHRLHRVEVERHSLRQELAQANRDVSEGRLSLLSWLTPDSGLGVLPLSGGLFVGFGCVSDTLSAHPPRWMSLDGGSRESAVSCRRRC